MKRFLFLLQSGKVVPSFVLKLLKNKYLSVCLCICARLRLCVNKCIVYIWLWWRRNIYVECRVVYCCCYIAQWNQNLPEVSFEFFKIFYCPVDFCTNLFVGMQEGPSGPKPQIKQTNKQHFTGNFWIFYYVFDGKYRKYLMKHQNLIATSKRTLAPMCDVLLLRQQAFSLSLLSLLTYYYIHTYIRA